MTLARQELRLQRIDLALVLIALRLEDVTDRHHADQPPLVHDRQMTDPPLGHGVGHREEIIGWLARDDVARHEVADRAREEALVACGLTHDVALGEDAHRAIALNRDQRADVVALQQRERLPDRLLGLHRHGHRALPRENVRDVHPMPPSVLLAICFKNNRAQA